MVILQCSRLRAAKLKKRLTTVKRNLQALRKYFYWKVLFKKLYSIFIMDELA